MEPWGRSSNAFRRVPGEGWKIIYEGRSVGLPELKGLHYIACLLSRPGEPVHVRDLAGRLEREGARLPVVASSLHAVEIERVRKAVSNRIRETIDKIAARDEELGLHLDRAIRTGTLCMYAPGRTVPWTL